MKKIKSKKINIDFKKLQKSSKNTNWQRGVYLALLITLAIFVIGCAYLMFRPIPSSIKEIVDEEILSTDISFNESALNDIRERQNPTQTPKPETGKNPFTPF